MIINTLDVDVFFYVFNTAVRTGRERGGIHGPGGGSPKPPLQNAKILHIPLRVSPGKRGVGHNGAQSALGWYIPSVGVPETFGG